MLYLQARDGVPGHPQADAFVRRAQGEFRNWERYLTQREVDQHNGLSYDALRTDLASGNDNIYFKIDRRFARACGRRPVELKVTYLDDGAAWALEYPGLAERSAMQTSPVVISQHTRERKTQTLALPEIPADGRFPRGMDFRLHTRADGCFYRMICFGFGAGRVRSGVAQTVRIGDSAHEIRVDAVPAYGGNDTAPSPIDYALAALTFSARPFRVRPSAGRDAWATLTRTELERAAGVRVALNDPDRT